MLPRFTLCIKATEIEVPEILRKRGIESVSEPWDVSSGQSCVNVLATYAELSDWYHESDGEQKPFPTGSLLLFTQR